jgi:predicted TPR repeat methyltransferase
MNSGPSSRDPAHFERLYDENPDPWQFQTSAYEQEKYRATLKSLKSGRFARGLEVGCSIGVLTAMLAAQCNELLGIDTVETALVQARARCAALKHVTFGRLHVPDHFPEGRFDLVVLSEVLYFLAEPDLARLATTVLAALQPRATVLLVNYTGRPGEPASGDPLTGDEAADRFIALTSSSLTRTIYRRAPSYRIDRLEYPGAAG